MGFAAVVIDRRGCASQCLLGADTERTMRGIHEKRNSDSPFAGVWVPHNIDLQGYCDSSTSTFRFPSYFYFLQLR